MLIATEAMVMGAGSIWEIFGLSIQLCYRPKSALKKIFFKVVFVFFLNAQLVC